MKKTLYETLGVAADAGTARIQAAYRHQLTLLEAQADLSASARMEAQQLLRVAFSTLSDPVSRHAYDARLAQAAAPTRTGTLVLVPDSDPAGPPAQDAQAEALALRAEALALRAEAMALRAGTAPVSPVEPGLGGMVTSGLLLGLKRFTRAIGLLVIVTLLAFGTTRALRGDPAARQAELERQAIERAALTEYQQMHGSRPGSLAEMERLESERRRAEMESRRAEQDREQQERDARRFEEESRQRGREVTAEMQMAEEQARQQEELERQRRQQEAQWRAESQRARAEADAQRAERERAQWREVLNR